MAFGLLRPAVRFVAAALGATALSLAAAGAESAPDYSDAVLIDGFVRTVFGVEAFGRGPKQEAYRVKKWDRAGMTVAIVNLSKLDRSRQVEDFVATLGRSVENLRIAVTNDATKANAVIFLVDRRDYRATIRQTLPKGQDTRFLESNDCSAVTGGPKAYRLSRAFIYVVADEGESRFRHCLVEETVQSLGPVNDDRTLADSIFNDYSPVDRFTVFDWYIVNMLYDPRIRPGMTRRQAEAVLPEVIRDVRRRLPAVLSRAGAAGPR
ncbi:DUF2927 domain-containing protein [Prosthecomicrobium sp. N25]|uniref:DUF2927 domain-containing protein n=1 Tax=Prosthecomicrobium sp. N25 TaxID=3129254 RepID=UPI00307799AE